MKMAWSNLRRENLGARIYKRIREGFDRKETQDAGRSKPSWLRFLWRILRGSSVDQTKQPPRVVEGDEV